MAVSSAASRCSSSPTSSDFSAVCARYAMCTSPIRCCWASPMVACLLAPFRWSVVLAPHPSGSRCTVAALSPTDCGTRDAPTRMSSDAPRRFPIAPERLLPEAIDARAIVFENSMFMG